MRNNSIQFEKLVKYLLHIDSGNTGFPAFKMSDLCFEHEKIEEDTTINKGTLTFYFGQVNGDTIEKGELHAGQLVYMLAVAAASFLESSNISLYVEDVDGNKIDVLDLTKKVRNIKVVRGEKNSA